MIRKLATAARWLLLSDEERGMVRDGLWLLAENYAKGGHWDERERVHTLMTHLDDRMGTGL